MGKASKWFRAVFGFKKSEPVPSSQHHHQQTPTRSKEKKIWSFVKSYREKGNHVQSQPFNNVSYDQVVPGYQVEELNRKNVLVPASAAVAEVAKLSSGHGGYVAYKKNSSSMTYVSRSHCWREDLAAIEIQSAFRGYLARRALRALKSLVRLQALVRGRIQRKRTAEWLYRMQVLLKAQARVLVGRIQISSESSLSSCKSSHFQHPGPPTPEKFEHSTRARNEKYGHSSILKRTGSKSDAMAIGGEDEARLLYNWSERRMDERSCVQRVNSARSGTMYDDRSDKILEMDTAEPIFTAKRRNFFHSFHTLPSDRYSHSFTNSKDSTTRQTVPSSSFSEVQSLTPLQFPQEDDEAFCTAENSPQFYSASSRGGSGTSPFTPGKSHVSTSFLSGYSYYPNYMSYTESSRAKVRSISAPKQRPQYERSNSTKRHSIHSFGEPRLSSTQRTSSLRANFTGKAYPGSGRLDRLGMPVGQRY